MTQHLILIGLPGSGKSTVGPLVAEALCVPFFDVDLLVAERTGRSIRDLFREDGEAAFRAAESAMVAELLDRPDRSVLAPGGGWAAVPGNLESSGRGLTVYLETPVEVAVDRATASGQRPVLEPDPTRRMTELLRSRSRWYRRADCSVSSRGTPAEVAARIVEVARTSGGW